eukprot:CAMPEP_0198214712 /NCGR_PEP_ID=MMETSP1445-20131203/43426_1 /TAXON_ID=36898 /ORGANISM="Pyramimonas sp., Strain CCMP2087" /LENGTH=149 /DNA_ID=CAMNT_0043890009 /DNA_START=221 /DNA_END=670 /DNA_ORIENTATION=+
MTRLEFIRTYPRPEHLRHVASVVFFFLRPLLCVRTFPSPAHRSHGCSHVFTTVLQFFSSGLQNSSAAFKVRPSGGSSPVGNSRLDGSGLLALSFEPFDEALTTSRAPRLAPRTGAARVSALETPGATRWFTTSPCVQIDDAIGIFVTLY